MYTPRYYKNENEAALHEFIRNNGFGILVSQAGSRPWATHIPMVLRADGKTLTGHIARGNAQWKSWNDSEVLAIFQGPHTYVSSSWYDHENAPTWNYLAVHVYGTIAITQGDELLSDLKQLLDYYEKNSEHPVTIEGMSEKFLRQEIQGIVGFKIAITKIESAFKLSQNRDDKNFNEVIHRLEQRADNNSHEVAREMRKLRPGLPPK
ncbi:MAG: FMN-binding negative transcriptional regulator [Bacteroidetes bacterium]|nr:FMN-binding negative transcriptional regulator [Bacteroidota bacterium]MBS1539263.1 FMN-binding negative transcriptional regulator [Bacteroidota bacterium]